MTTKHPLISVLLPNYNHGRYLSEAIESILCQTYPNFEIIAVDDGSTDNSVEILRAFELADSRVRPIYFANNRGVLPALESAFERSSGDLIYGIGADDAIVHPDFFAFAVKAFARYPSAGGFFGKQMVIDADDDHPLSCAGDGAHAGFITPTEFVRSLSSGYVIVPGGSCIWRVEALRAVGGFDQRLGHLVDYYFCHAIPVVFGAVYDPTVFAKWRYSPKRASLSSGASLEQVFSRYGALRDKFVELNETYPFPMDLVDDWIQANVRLAVFDDAKFRRGLGPLLGALRRVLPPELFGWARLRWRKALLSLGKPVNLPSQGIGGKPPVLENSGK